MLFIFALAGVLLALPARAHESWINKQMLRDPQSGEFCCNEHDCRPEKVVETRGGYMVETGEVIPYHRVIWRSPDGTWWRCRAWHNGQQRTRCLLGPPPGS